MKGVSLNCRFDPDVYERLAAYCHATGRDRQALIRSLVDRLCSARDANEFNRACVAALDAIDSIVRAPPAAEAVAPVEPPPKKARARSA